MYMNKKLMIPLMIFIIMASSIVSASAHDKENRGGNDGNQRFELKIRNEVKDEREIENEIENKLEVNGQEFEIRGEISAVSGNTFVVLGQTITVDPSKVSKFKQKGILEVGKRVKAEGVIQNGTKFASEINVIGTGQGRFKFEVRGNNITLNPTAIITPTGVAPSGTITPTPTTESASFDAKVKVKAQGSIDQVIAFLKQVMTLLENLI